MWRKSGWPHCGQNKYWNILILKGSPLKTCATFILFIILFLWNYYKEKSLKNPWRKCTCFMIIQCLDRLNHDSICICRTWHSTGIAGCLIFVPCVYIFLLLTHFLSTWQHVKACFIHACYTCHILSKNLLKRYVYLWSFHALSPQFYWRS